MAGESDFIDWLRGQKTATPPRAPDLVLVPPGDDLAVLKWSAGDLLLVGADQVLDGVHFNSAVHSPRQIGRKAMNRNLSDCAAMACVPAAAVATVAAPRGVGVDYLKELYLGLRDAADAFGCAVVGGDTGSWGGKLAMSVTILGRSAGVEPVRRSGARPGDAVCVTGPLGGSLLGRHMDFRPRVNEAIQLARHCRPTSMIDLSDGLSRDLGHLCRESGVGAVVTAAAVPVHDDVARMPPGSRTLLEHALHDGEDYELLFTVPQNLISDLPLPAHVVGAIQSEPGVWVRHPGGRREALAPKGWEHSL